MKHIFKIFSLLVALSAFWIGLLQAAIVPRRHTWLLPIYFIVSLCCHSFTATHILHCLQLVLKKQCSCSRTLVRQENP